MKRRPAFRVLQVDAGAVTEHHLGHVVPLRLDGVHQRRHAPPIADVRVGAGVEQDLGAPAPALLAAEVQRAPEERLPERIVAAEDRVRVDALGEEEAQTVRVVVVDGEVQNLFDALPSRRLLCRFRHFLDVAVRGANQIIQICVLGLSRV